MPGVVRLGDRCSGHDCFPPRPCISASPNVFTNGKGTHRVGDSWAKHCCGKHCHTGIAVNGSSTVLVNGKGVFRQGDLINCGSKGNECSPNVIAN